ncbi:MAG: hypothetical protein EOP24_47465 [Hyphomicrobiales bacterium]|nr:MAG: hypothetical protein EOP24_47465 [Hyphomicrobiales bacterium]
MFDLIRRFAICAALGTVLVLSGCAQVKLGTPVASADNIQAAKASGLPSTSVGAFTLAAGVPKSVDQAVSIRSNSFFSPFDSSFAKYLQETLTAELRAAGLFEASATTIISGELTKSAVEAGASQGTASLGARFKLTRSGSALYEKELVVNDSWDSSFVGAVAIPSAANHYTALYARLVKQLLEDVDFRKAVKR